MTESSHGIASAKGCARICGGVIGMDLGANAGSALKNEALKVGEKVPLAWLVNCCGEEEVLRSERSPNDQFQRSLLGNEKIVLEQDVLS